MRTRVNHAVKNRLPQKCMCTTYQGTLASSRHRPCSSQIGPSFPLKNKGHTTCHVCLPLSCLSGMSRSVCCQSARRSAVGCLSVCLLSVRPSACCRSVCGLSARLSVCCSVRLFAVRSVCLLLVRLAVWRLVGPSVCCRSICLSVCCWSVRPSARPSNCCRPVCLSAVDPSECLSVCCSVRPSCCSVRLSAVGRSVALSVYPSHAMILTCTSNDVIRALSSG